MATTASQKLAAVALPVAAIGLALATAGPDWSPPRRHYGSWKAWQDKPAAEKAAAKEAAAAPAPGPAGAPAGPAEGATKPGPAEEAGVPGKPATPGAARPGRGNGTPAGKTAEAAGGGGAPVAGPAKKEPVPAKPAIPKVEEIEFRVTGLAAARSGLPLKTPSADRLDVHVLVSAYRIGADFVDPDRAKESIRSADGRLKSDGLLFVLPNARAPFDSVEDLLLCATEAGWVRIALGAAHPDNPGQARVLPLAIPSNEAADIARGLDAVTVRVLGSGASPSFELNGEACKDASALEAKAKALHEEYELMAEDYAAEVDRTPWTVDGTGAQAGGVVAALDALANAGVKSARIAGVRRPGAGTPGAGTEAPGAEEKK